MKIVIVCQYFYPEEFKVNDLAEEWVKRGHEVTVLTGKPNYPKGKIYEGYKFWGIHEEEYKGAKVIRVPIVPRGKGGGLKLFINYFSYVISSFCYLCFHRIEADKIFCFETSPILQMYPALFLKKKTKAPADIWVQDLWPESVAAASSLKSPFVMKILSKMVKSIYKGSDKIFVQSTAFKESVVDKGPFEDKIVYAPNWAEDIFLDESKIDRKKYASIMPEGFKIMFAGNVGAAQDFESVINAANETKEYPDIKWVIVGDGRMRESAEERVKELGLVDTVKFLGRHSVTEMPSFFVHADAMLVSLKKEYIFSLTIPSKVQAYMASGKPIVTMLSGIGNQIIEEASCGMTAESGDYRTLAHNVIMMYKKSKEELQQMGFNGRMFYNTNFDKNRVIDTLSE